jgi:hypothetical protein
MPESASRVYTRHGVFGAGVTSPRVFPVAWELLTGQCQKVRPVCTHGRGFPAAAEPTVTLALLVGRMFLEPSRWHLPRVFERLVGFSRLLRSEI